MERLQHIQYLRGLAALLVLGSHFGGITTVFADHEAVVKVSSIFNGAFGVDIFFVISGFIMVYTCRSQFAVPGAAGLFLWRRVIRIVPIYWLMTIVEAGILFVSRLDRPDQQITVNQLLSSLLFVPYDWHDDKFRPLLGPGWSLNYEMFFYAVFAGVLFLPLKRALIALTVIFTGLALVGLLSPPGAVLMAWTRPIILEFLAGALLAGVYFWLKTRNALPRFDRPMLLAALFLVIQALLPDPEGGLSAWNWTNWMLATLIVGTATLLAARTHDTLSSRIMTALGDASYSLYLTHVIVLALLEAVWKKTGLFDTAGLAAFVVIGLISTLCVGWLSHKLIETPLTMMLKRLGERRRPVAIA